LRVFLCAIAIGSRSLASAKTRNCRMAGADVAISFVVLFLTKYIGLLPMMFGRITEVDGSPSHFLVLEDFVGSS